MSLLVRRRIGMLTAIALIVPPAVALSASPAFACTGGLWQNVRYVDGVTWLGWNTEPSTPPGGVGQVNTATIEMYSYPLTFVSNTNADGILVNYQFDTGNASWSGWDTLGAPPGTALWTTMAGEPNSGLDMIAATTSGLFFNDVFPGPRGWQEIAQPPVDLQNIGFYPVMTGMSNGDMVTMIGAPEGLVYADVRYASGGWSGWSQVPNVPRGVMYDLAITGDQNDEVQVVALAANDGTDILYHTVWSGPPSGTWQGWDEPPQPPDVNYSRFVTAAQTPSDGNTQDNTQILDTVIDPNMNGGWGQIYGNVRDGYGGAWQGWEQIATPNAVLDGSQGVPIGSPTWSNIGAEEVWAEAPTFCPT